jgi:hypothetical protein
MSSVTYPVRPATSIAPPSPATAPDAIATSISVRVTGTPAKRAARAFAPTARTSKPNVVSPIAAHASTHNAIATSSPACTRVRSISFGSSTASSSATLCGQPIAVGSFIGPSSIIDMNSRTMKLSSAR